MLSRTIIAWLLALAALVLCVVWESPLLFFIGVILFIAAGLLSWGLFSLQPNAARVLVLFGDYQGTVRKDGFHWANPFSVHRSSITVVTTDPSKPANQTLAKQPNRYLISLRSRNFETQTLKVNDQRGNPIEIGAVVVWRVQDTAQASFDVDDYEDYVKVQSETAVRHLANCYPYDHGNAEDSESIVTLRDNTDVISDALQKELQVRLGKAGVVVEEARLTHLAYAPEIAGAMLRRQQAEAIISARQKIVQGAVGMVEMALSELSSRGVVELDEEKKVAMVSNLLVVLCGDHQVDPVINTGTLYH
jgi:regulator of protease activity HflC (stomatin/prohibitin superfamily)